MNVVQLKVEKRDQVGTGKLNALRAQGWVPGVLYGTAIGQNINLRFREADLRNLLGNAETDSLLVEIEIDGKKVLTLVKSVQHNHLTDSITHVDLLAVTPETVVLAKVPMHLKGTPVGVAMGGQVQQLVYDLPVRCAVQDLPEVISLDISPLTLGESLRLSQISLPEKVTTPFNGTVVLVSVVKS